MDDQKLRYIWIEREDMGIICLEDWGWEELKEILEYHPSARQMWVEEEGYITQIERLK